MAKIKQYKKVIEYPGLKDMKGVIFDDFDKPSHFIREWFFSGFLFIFLTIFAIPCWIVALFSERKVHFEEVKLKRRKE